MTMHSEVDPKTVLDRHLRYATAGDTERDIAENYAEDAVVLATGGAHGTSRRFQGPDGVRRSRAELADALGSEVTFDIHTRLVEGELAVIRWTAVGEGGAVVDGVDSFLVRDGKIKGQTINYTVKSPHRSAGGDTGDVWEEGLAAAE